MRLELEAVLRELSKGASLLMCLWLEAPLEHWLGLLEAGLKR